jgi:hypothetical protein
MLPTEHHGLATQYTYYRALAVPAGRCHWPTPVAVFHWCYCCPELLGSHASCCYPVLWLQSLTSHRGAHVKAWVLVCGAISRYSAHFRRWGLVEEVWSLEECPWKGYLDPSPFLLFFFVSLPPRGEHLCSQVLPTMRFGLATGPKAMEPGNHKLKLFKPWGWLCKMKRTVLRNFVGIKRDDVHKVPATVTNSMLAKH